MGVSLTLSMRHWMDRWMEGGKAIRDLVRKVTRRVPARQCSSPPPKQQTIDDKKYHCFLQPPAILPNAFNRPCNPETNLPLTAPQLPKIVPSHRSMAVLSLGMGFIMNESAPASKNDPSKSLADNPQIRLRTPLARKA